MHRTRFLLALPLFLLFLVTTATAQPITTSVYLDATNGSDSNDGLTPETAWKTLNKVNISEFGPGAKILLKAGEQWQGFLKPNGSGAEGAPIILSSYGEGPKPAIHGGGVPYVIHLFNQQYWEIENLEITNLQDVAEGQTPTRKRGIYIAAKDIGAVKHLHVRNVTVHDVNSEYESHDSRYYGGIFFQIQGTDVPTWFDGVLVENCHVYDVDRTGISNDSSWWIRGLDSKFGDVVGQTASGPNYDNWIPSVNMVFRNNLLERIAGNGFMIRVSRGTIVEHNKMFENGLKISGNAFMCFNTDSTIVQFNEAAYTVWNPGDTDARGLDSDYRTKHTIIQYNYVHNNGLGGIVATGGPGGETSVPRYNYGTIIRYNILVDNVKHPFRASGNLLEMKVYNNIVYTGPDRVNTTIVEHDAWTGAWPENTTYYNNIFYNAGPFPRYYFGKSVNTQFFNNLYAGNPSDTQPEDPGAILADPLFVDIEAAVNGDLDGFRLLEGSPALGAGVRVEGFPEVDFFGNVILGEAPVDVGVHQVTGESTGTETLPEGPVTEVVFYPNPAVHVGTVRFPVQGGTVDLELYDVLGRRLAAWQVNGSAGEAKLNLQELSIPTGMYFLVVKGQGKQEITNFIWRGNGSAGI